MTRSREPADPELFARLPGDSSAREELLIRHQPLARYLARRFAGRGEALEDLEQVAGLALLKAIDRFDPSRDVLFSTYATVTVVGELKRHLRDRGWALRLPRRLKETTLLVNRSIPELWQEHGRSPTVQEIAERTGVSEEEVLEAMDAAQSFAPDSLDAPPTESGLAASETLAAEDETVNLVEGWASVAPLLEQLTERERRTLYLRFFKDMTQTEIAQELGISQMHVSRLLSHTLAFLRERAGGA